MKRTYLSAAVMALLGTGVFLAAEHYQPQPAAAPTEAAPETIEETAGEDSARLLASPDETEAEEIITPSPTELNLIHLFPEGADTTDKTKSCAGEAFRILMTQDETWMSGIYDYSDYTPLSLAERLGRTREQVTGRYNPKDSTHDPQDPSTWTINSFKDIRMQVTDGDGRPISAYSNVIDIMSMANVYTWYQDYQDYDLFLEYAKELWQASHSYTVSMSDIYYCSGCLDEAAEAREQEQLEAAARAEEQGYITEEGIGTEGSSSQEAASPVILSNHGQKETAAETAASAETATEMETTASSIITAGQSRRETTAAVSESGLDSEQDGVENEDSSQAQGETQSVGDETQAEQESLPAAADGAGQSLEVELAEESTAPGTDGTSLTSPAEHSVETGIENSSETIDTEAAGINAAGTESAPGDDRTAVQATAADGTSNDSEALTAPETDAQLATESNASGNSSGHTDCPGHIDLIIRMKICGLDETNGLYTLDTVGNDESNITEQGWPGWNDETKGYVTQLSSRDWFQEYGLSVSVISMLNPLSLSEVEDYLAKLPENLTAERRSLVEFALSSVGKVPYYWGGKASHPGYEGNQFSSLVSPDTKGRVLKGLDCSGWISWVYWSVTGNRLPYESTSGLAICGTRISRQQLQPGDIIVRTGDDAHVIMFLGWTEDGRILCVHESSAGVNNVTVAVRDANWPYYRKLLD